MIGDVSFWDLIDYPVTSEKAVRLIEDENKLIFQLKRINIWREEVKKSFEDEFKVKLDKINILITRKGTKRAILKLKPEFHAGDIGVKLGII